MNSINKNQKENNFENLMGKDGIEKVQELVNKADTCFFCSAIETDRSFETRPMTPQKVDDSGTIWFLSSKDSHKNLELQENPKAQLLFQGSTFSNYLSLYGNVVISQDKEKIHELWEPTLKTWFTEGEDDSRITVLEFVPTEGYYWDTKNGIAVATVKRLFGAVVGETYDDSMQGNITV
jgi:general stress protein 26